jgi:hypothetical protein
VAPGDARGADEPLERKERTKGFGPDAVALFQRVEEVWHNGGGKSAVGLEETGVEVNPDDAFAIGETADDGVRFPA